MEKLGRYMLYLASFESDKLVEIKCSFWKLRQVVRFISVTESLSLSIEAHVKIGEIGSTNIVGLRRVALWENCSEDRSENFGPLSLRKRKQNEFGA